MSVRNTITVAIVAELKTFFGGRLGYGRYASAGKLTRAIPPLTERHEPDLTTARKRPADSVSDGR